MRYHAEEAMGLIETLGMVPAIYGADAMLKAADVQLFSYENVGSTLVTIMVKGRSARLCGGGQGRGFLHRQADGAQRHAPSRARRGGNRHGAQRPRRTRGTSAPFPGAH